MAILLYGGLVLSESAQVFEGRIPIETMNQPKTVALLSNLGDIRVVRYFAPDNAGIRVDSNSFRATVDLAGIDPTTGLVSLAVKVVAIDQGIQVREYEPSRINVQIDEVVSRAVPVKVDWGVPPAGLDVRDPILSTETVAVAGPASIVRRVAAAEARLRIDASGLDIDRDVELVPVDDLGEVLAPVDVTPATVRVRIAVFTNRDTKSLPVTPIINGLPAAGFEIASVTVDPPVVSVEGDADQLAGLTRIDTVPVSIAGASASVSIVTGLSLPTGVLPINAPSVTVRITLRQVAATRTLSAGIVLVGTRPDLAYSLSGDRVLVTIGGTSAELDRIAGSAFTVSIDVSGVTIGVRSLPVSVALPAGVTLLSVSPGTVAVTAAEPAPVPSPSIVAPSPTAPAPSPSSVASP
jgi:YbbR domain-containing protein